MEQLVELLKQIQDLAGVAIDALTGGEGKDKQGPEGSPQEERSEPPAEAKSEGDQMPPRG
jgi:hypothetical protein